MKKILMALMMIGLAYSSAEAQTKVACGKPEGKVCTKKGCYKTKYAENFKICKSDYGYFVCCEEPNSTNSTFPKMNLAGMRPYQQNNDQSYVMQQNRRTDADEMNEDMLVPQSQSYPKYSANAATSYTGNYPKKIRVCSNTDNVAEANREAYSGCPTPAYDGPDKNAARNINYSNPNSSFPQPPNSGNKQ